MGRKGAPSEGWPLLLLSPPISTLPATKLAREDDNASAKVASDGGGGSGSPRPTPDSDDDAKASASLSCCCCDFMGHRRSLAARSVVERGKQATRLLWIGGLLLLLLVEGDWERERAHTFTRTAADSLCGLLLPWFRYLEVWLERHPDAVATAVAIEDVNERMMDGLGCLLRRIRGLFVWQGRVPRKVVVVRCLVETVPLSRPAGGFSSPLRITNSTSRQMDQLSRQMAHMEVHVPSQWTFRLQSDTSSEHPDER